MLKNVAGQKIGAGMVSAVDGTAFTGAVTVYVCGDAGTQAAGSVGSGACTHEGNGYHTYAPSQAETNYDLIAFTFTGTNAVPATVQVLTVSELWTAAAERTALGLASANLDTQLSTIAGYIDTEVAAIKAKTDNLPADTNTLLTSTGIKVASIANGAIAAATFAANALDAVWSTATRTLTAISDSAGITTLLSRIIGTLASGTHQPQSGDAYARLGAPAGASVSADIATKASQASVNALADRLAEQVPTGPVMVLPAPETGQTVAYVRCLSSAGAAESEVIVHVQMVRTRAGATGYAYSGDALVGESNADGLAAITIPRAPGAIFRAWRGDTGRQITFAGVDAETVAIPDLLGD